MIWGEFVDEGRGAVGAGEVEGEGLLEGALEFENFGVGGVGVEEGEVGGGWRRGVGEDFNVNVVDGGKGGWGWG